MAEHIIYKLGPLQMPNLGDKRFVRVYLPPGGEKRPLRALYMFDGQNVFHDEPSFSGGWHMHDVARAMSEQGMDAPAIIGIDHGGASRIHGLSPFECNESLGKCDEFLQWVVSSVMPAVRGAFELREGPENTLIGGSSLGGLAALYAHFRHPAVFGGALCMSPSFWLADGKISEFLASSAAPRTSRIYVDGGGREGNGSVVARAQQVVAQLRGMGYGEDKLRFVVDPDGEHTERDWRRRAPEALRFLCDASASVRERVSIAA